MLRVEELTQREAHDEKRKVKKTKEDGTEEGEISEAGDANGALPDDEDEEDVGPRPKKRGKKSFLSAEFVDSDDDT